MYKELETGEVVYSVTKLFKTKYILLPNMQVKKKVSRIRGCLVGAFIFFSLIVSVMLESLLFFIGSFLLFSFLVYKHNDYLIKKYPETAERITFRESMLEYGKSHSWFVLVFMALFCASGAVHYFNEVITVEGEEIDNSIGLVVMVALLSLFVFSIKLKLAYNKALKQTD